VPAGDGVWLDQDQGVLPAWPGVAEANPECARGVRQLRAWRFVLEDGELLPQGQVLEHEVVSGPEQGQDQPDENTNQEAEHGESLPSLRTVFKLPWALNSA
jgi:hypothetical protein